MFGDEGPGLEKVAVPLIGFPPLLVPFQDRNALCQAVKRPALNVLLRRTGVKDVLGCRLRLARRTTGDRRATYNEPKHVFPLTRRRDSGTAITNGGWLRRLVRHCMPSEESSQFCFLLGPPAQNQRYRERDQPCGRKSKKAIFWSLRPSGYSSSPTQRRKQTTQYIR
jgi:hypothetical protein